MPLLEKKLPPDSTGIFPEEDYEAETEKFREEYDRIYGAELDPTDVLPPTSDNYMNTATDLTNILFGDEMASVGVELDKEGFVGRPALLKADRNTLIYGVKCPSTAPHDHTEILEGATRVGRVTAGAWSPFLESGIGYVRFKHPGNWAGKSLLMRTQQGELVECEIVELPFYDSEKRIPRGMEAS